MVDPNQPPQRQGLAATIRRLAGWLKTGVLGLLALASLGVALIGVVVTLLLGSEGAPFWAAGVGAGSLGFGYVAWRVFPRFWKEPPAQQRNQSETEAPERPSGGRGPKPTTGRFALVNWLRTVGPWIGKLLLGWYVLLPLLGTGLVFTLVGIASIADGGTQETVLGSIFAPIGLLLLSAGGWGIYRALRPDPEEQQEDAAGAP